MHVVGTAGHVDHGKSSLVQRLTGIDPDRFAEEKRRGLTIDLGFAWLHLPSGREVGLIDVPGHERFIKNMLAGAGGISVCLLVVAANEGWMPQSSEHLAILDVLGISSGIVALTKSDLVDAETLAIASAEVEEHLAETSLAGAPVVVCSATSGHGLDELVEQLDRVVKETPAVPDLGRPRLWVDRVFTIAGAGTVVTGTVAGGTFANGDEVEISPRGRRARIRAIQTHKKSTARVAPGNRAALNLAGLHRGGAERGDAVVQPRRWRPTRRLDATIRVLSQELSGSTRAITEKGAYLLYAGSAETPVRLRLLAGERLPAGTSGVAQLELRDPLPLARGDRFVLRDAGRVMTFGGGVVLDPLPSVARRGDRARIALLQRLERATEEQALADIVRAEGAVPVDDALLRSGARALPASVVRLGDSLRSPARVDELRAAVRAALGRYHERHPLERGMAREALRAVTALRPDEFDDLVSGMSDVVADGPVVRLETHSVMFDPEQQAARKRLLERIEAGGFSPPLAGELDAEPALLRALEDAGDLVRIADFYLTADQAAEARARTRSAIEQHGPITVAQIRDLLGTSRKYAVPLCEWLDATGATRRQGDTRALGPVA